MDRRLIAVCLIILAMTPAIRDGAAAPQDDPDWVETRERIVVELRGDRKRVPPHLLVPENLDILLQHLLDTYKKGRFQGQLPESRNDRRRVAAEAAEILEDHSDDLEDLEELENELRPMYPVLGTDPADPTPVTLPGWPAIREAVLAALDEDTPDPQTLDPGFAGLDALILHDARRWRREPEDLAAEREQRSTARGVVRPYQELLTLRQRVQQTAALWPPPPSVEDDDYQPVDDPNWASIREMVPAAAKVLNGDPVYSFLDARVVDGLIRTKLERNFDGEIPDSPARRRQLLSSVGYDYRTKYMVTRPALERLEARVRERFADPLILEFEDGKVVVNLGLVPGAVVPGRSDVQGPMTDVPTIPVPDTTVFRVGKLLLAYRERFPEAEPLGLVYEFYRGRDEEAEAVFHFQRGDRIILVDETGGRGTVRYRASPELGGLERAVDVDGDLAIEAWILVNPPRRRIHRLEGERWHRPAPPWVYTSLRALRSHLWER